MASPEVSLGKGIGPAVGSLKSAPTIFPVQPCELPCWALQSDTVDRIW